MNTADTFALGLRCHQAGDFSQAEQLYRQILDSDPHHCDALHLLGLLELATGRTESGIGHIRQVLRLDPSCIQAYFNLGSALRGQGQLDEAIASYRQALALQPNNARSHLNLGHALKERGLFQEAIASYQQALRLDPTLARAHLNLGILLGEQGKVIEAETSFRHALQLDPEDAGAHLALASALGEQGRSEEAVACCQRALQLRPDDPTTQFLCAALTGMGRPVAAPREYVADLFDRDSAAFEAHLVTRLGYRGPQVLREAVADPSGANGLDILDLGCGTGLCGLAFRDMARTLTGVDLSARMLDQARARGVYDRLIHGDLLEALNPEAGAFHLILAGDVFPYVGDLTAVFRAVRRTLRPDGRFVFLVEAHEGDDYVLRASKRFAHSLAYLRNLARSSALAELSARKEVVRKERGQDVEFYVVALQAS